MKKNMVRNSLLLIAITIVAAVASHPARAATADADFAARCNAPGVVLCKGLDTESELMTGEIVQASDGTRQGFIDTAIKSSGAGSLKFKLRKGVRSANIGGAWSTALGKTFNVGDTIYVQWRQRISTEYITNNKNYWRSTVKQINIHGPNSTCQGAEFTTVQYNNYPSMYTNCGDGFMTDVNTNALLSRCSDDCLIQQGSSLTPSPNGNGYNCHYQNQVPGIGDGNGCFYTPSNTWVTYYEKIHIGTFGGSNSAIDAYVAVNGGPYKQIQRVSGIHFNNNRDNNFQYIRLETYMTELERSGSAAPVDAYQWFDELIVSTQPIAAPGGSSSVEAPASPKDLLVMP